MLTQGRQWLILVLKTDLSRQKRLEIKLTNVLSEFSVQEAWLGKLWTSQ